ncbi:MAG: riboflavin biosynthesis protein RibF, partial [Actinomycetota bacterium]
ASMRRHAESALPLTVVTFDRHPLSVVRPEAAPRLLTDIETKLDLLASLGVDTTCVVPFDERRATEEPETFIEDVLVNALGAKYVVVGEDFRFGRNRRGDVALLGELGERFGFEVFGLDLAGFGDQPISSTRIRQLVASGEVRLAAELLGRSFSLRGMVEHGDGRGGPELGFPTANLGIADGLAQPGVGIYAGYVTLTSGEVVQSAISVGRRPTFYEHADPLIECYLLDFDRDLYGQQLEVTFVEKLRDEQRFETVDALIDQMHRDVEATRTILTAAE